MTETTTATTVERIGVPIWVVAEAQARVAKLAERVVKKGLTGFHAEVTSANPRPETILVERVLVPTGTTLVDLTISFVAPVLAGGWSLSGILDFDSVPGSVLLQTVPGHTIPEAYRSTEATTCDHCHAARRRNKVIVVESETGEFARVGSTCVKDFLGVSPETLIAYYHEVEDALEEIDRGGREGGYGAPTWDTRYILALALAVVKVIGWVSRQTARDFDRTATADHIVHILDRASRGKLHQLSSDQHLAYETSGDYAELADEVVAWVTTEWDGGAEWGANLRVALAAEQVTGKAIGLVASATVAWSQHQDKLAAIEVERTEVPDAWIGTVGKREVFTGKVLTIRWFESQFGSRALVRIATEAGLIKTWNSGKFAEGIEVGDTVTFKATVKDHETYNDRKETLVERAAIFLTPAEKKAAKAEAEAAAAARDAEFEAHALKRRIAADRTRVTDSAKWVINAAFTGIEDPEQRASTTLDVYEAVTETIAELTDEQATEIGARLNGLAYAGDIAQRYEVLIAAGITVPAPPA